MTASFIRLKTYGGTFAKLLTDVDVNEVHTLQIAGGVGGGGGGAVTAVQLPAALGPTTKSGALVVTAATDDPSALSLDTIKTTLDAVLSAVGVGNGLLTEITGRDEEIQNDLTPASVAGNVASGVADTGNPIGLGFQARTSNPTAVTNAQRVVAIADKLGKQVVVGSIRDLKTRATVALTANTAETTLLAAVASVFLDLYGLIITNTSATAVASVTLRDTTGGSAVAVFAVPAGETRGFMLPESAALKQTTVNTNWTVQSGTSVSSLQVTALAVQNI